MNNEMNIFEFTWDGQAITIEFYPNWSKAYRDVYGYSLVHLKIRSQDGQPMPLSRTGFYSTFLPEPSLENYDSPVEYVKDWMDFEADQASWKTYEDQARQGTLF